MADMNPLHAAARCIRFADGLLVLVADLCKLSSCIFLLVASL